MILYEYPFNERIRTYLRLERLFLRLGELVPRDAPVDHHFALTTIFEVMDVAARADLKGEVMKDIERQRQALEGFRGNPAIAEHVLDKAIRRLESCFAALDQQPGKAGQELTENDWLMSVRSRSSIPGGTCEFDLPAYYAWQHKDAFTRRADIERWTTTLAPTADAIHVLLQMLRDSGSPQKVMTAGGLLQQNLPQGRAFQLLRLRIDPRLDLIPEISCNRLLVSLRLMRVTPEGRLAASADDVPFEMTLCA